MKGHFLFGVICCIFVLIFNIWSLVILRKKKQIRKFDRLVIALSVSDIFISLEYLYSLINDSFVDRSTLLYQYQSLITKHLIGGTYVFSLFQTVQICLEQLNATFFPKKRILKVLASKTASVICFTVCHLASLLRFILIYDHYQAIRCQACQFL